MYSLYLYQLFYRIYQQAIKIFIFVSFLSKFDKQILDLKLNSLIFCENSLIQNLIKIIYMNSFFFIRNFFHVS